MIYGIKFIKPSLLLKYTRRSEAKDFVDIRFLQEKLSVKKYTKLIILIKSKYRYQIYLLHRRVVKILELLKLKDLVNRQLGNSNEQPKNISYNVGL